MEKAEIRKMIDSSYSEKGMSYEDYRRLLDALIIVGRSTAKKESKSLLEHSKLNVARMKRLDKTVEIIPGLKRVIECIDEKQTWLVLTEGWCGDAAQIVPVFAKIAALNNKVDLRFLLRDENLELMDMYLQNDRNRSIPKLIVLNENFKELFNWGPRPKALQEMFYHMRANAMDGKTIKEEMHRWYTQNKTIATQEEIADLLEKTVCNYRAAQKVA